MPDKRGDTPQLEKSQNPKVSWDQGEALQIIARCASLKGGLMEALHGLQQAFGFIPAQSHALLAERFNLSEAEVYGVKSFYHDFTSAPKGRHVIQVCQAEACQALGSRALTNHAQNQLGITLGQTSPDGQFTLEAVYCLGNCAVSPNITMDGKPYGRMSEARFDSLLKKAAL